ncbi:MAG: hypothetical protein JWO08_3887 [Verrucomicrobiaceae bacterium]|nr:hypothetical protein [Verrucomicrobiaceae bacterium]
MTGTLRESSCEPKTSHNPTAAIVTTATANATMRRLLFIAIG